MTNDSRVTKLAAHYANDRAVRFLPQTFSLEELAEIGANAISHMERAGLVVTDPTAAPYSLLTHEYPPTLEIAVDTIRRLATVNQVMFAQLFARQAEAWEQGHTAGWEDATDVTHDFTGKTKTPNPYKQEATND